MYPQMQIQQRAAIGLMCCSRQCLQMAFVACGGVPKLVRLLLGTECQPAAAEAACNVLNALARGSASSQYVHVYLLYTFATALSMHVATYPRVPTSFLRVPCCCCTASGVSVTMDSFLQINIALVKWSLKHRLKRSQGGR